MLPAQGFVGLLWLPFLNGAQQPPGLVTICNDTT